MTRSLPTQPLQIAVVGHTNTGKTSLLRTLTRDKYFGEVSAMPSTTRHVEASALTLDRQVVLELFDTPGLEESIALLEQLEALGAGAERLDGPARIERFLASEDARGRFEQEAKVLRQMLRCDAAVYVIDARDPVLAKHRDELTILHACGIPLLPLLNFVGTPRAHEKTWREALARLGLHVVVAFDTVAPAHDGEQTLYTRLATLLNERGQVLLALARSHAAQVLQRRQEAAALLAELLIDTAAYRRAVEAEPGSTAAAAALSEFNQRIRAREQSCVDALLQLYRFTRDDIEASQLPISAGAWKDDLFSPETLKAFGMQVGGGAAAGAAAGLGVDLMLGGASLGTGAAVGALLGGGAQTLRHFGRRVGDRLLGALTGNYYLQLDDALVQVLLTRQWYLVRALEARGHAAQAKLSIGDTAMGSLWREALGRLVAHSRLHPEWSCIDGRGSWDVSRQQLSEQMAAQLEHTLQRWSVQD
ncbi:MAG: DUF3482 domain-containing protein [Pseudomonadales bacterium]|nr:DUF3482 domain-containing protein [Pseudomonadales bacterium]MCP5329324.1 DUF3482 domain-containing protein [Pseudomonadales bacterium]